MHTRDLSAVPAGPPPVLHSMERTRALKLVELTELFLPHVSAILKPRMMKGINSMMRLILEDAPEVRPLIASLRDGTAPPERKAAFRACGIGFVPLTLAGLRQNGARIVRDSVEAAAMKLALAWLANFLGSPGEALVIDTDALDDAMLPPPGQYDEQIFAAWCDDANLTVEEAREVLRQVKAGLKTDPAFPDAACDILDATLVCIRR